ncbi:MAG: hypothetical protein EPO02_13405 [Nitrospirae bacterium]|nr:MAG: hypothetical protein EPO02_13405 [Nitrospirota bacterium]
MMKKICLRCGQKLSGKKKKYCSQKCSKLYLKSEYRKRNRERLNEYQRNYRRAKNGGNRPPKLPAKLRNAECLKCGSTEDLQLAHIKPLWAGGKHKWIITLCRKHHFEFDSLLRDWWRDANPLPNV